MILFKAWPPVDLQNVHGWWMRNISTVGHRYTHIHTNAPPTKLFPPLCPPFSLSLNYYDKNRVEASLKHSHCVCVCILKVIWSSVCVLLHLYEGVSVFKWMYSACLFWEHSWDLHWWPVWLIMQKLLLCVRVFVRTCLRVCLFSVWVGGSVVWGARMKELPLWLSHELCGLLMGTYTRMCAHYLT